jgi:hypothetical protein
VIAEAKLPALFHTGQTGVGAGTRGGGGIRLKYSNPLHLDDVAADFPDMPIVLAHPSFPWQEEALSVATHKPQVYIDLSGWSPKYFPPTLVQYQTLPNTRSCSDHYPDPPIDGSRISTGSTYVRRPAARVEQTPRAVGTVKRARMLNASAK